METSFENQPGGQQPIDQPVPQRLDLGEEAQAHLRETKQWANFLSILGFIFIGLIVVAALVFGVVFSTAGAGNPDWGGFPGALIVLVYLAMALFYFFPVLFLFKFADNMGKALSNGNLVTLNAAFRNLRSHYRFIGILAIVIISLYIFGIMFAITIGPSLLGTDPF